MDRAEKFSYVAFLLSLSILVASIISTGCSGQYAVTNTGTITTHQWVRVPDAPRHGSIASGGPVWSYFTAPTYGVFYVENGTSEEFVTRAKCADGFDVDVTVPPHTGQRILVTTTINGARDGLCKITDPQ